LPDDDLPGRNFPQGHHDIFVFRRCDQVLGPFPYLPDPFGRRVNQDKPVGNPFQTVFYGYSCHNKPPMQWLPRRIQAMGIELFL
jgi:hypothetical protein